MAIPSGPDEYGRFSKGKFSRHIDDEGRKEEGMRVRTVRHPVFNHRLRMCREEPVTPFHNTALRSTGKTVWTVVDKLEPVLSKDHRDFSCHTRVATIRTVVRANDISHHVERTAAGEQGQALVVIVLQRHDAARTK